MARPSPGLEVHAIDVQAAHHVAHVQRSGADLRRGGRHRGNADAAAVDLNSGRSGLGYRKSHHQIAKAAVANTAVMAVEISNENAANLIQSVTAHDFQSSSITASKV